MFLGRNMFVSFVHLFTEKQYFGVSPSKPGKILLCGITGSKSVFIYFFILIPVQPMKAVSRIHLLPYQLTEFVWSNRMFSSIEANCLRWDTSSVEFCKICWFVSFSYNRERWIGSRLCFYIVCFILVFSLLLELLTVHSAAIVVQI